MMRMPKTGAGRACASERMQRQQQAAERETRPSTGDSDHSGILRHGLVVRTELNGARLGHSGLTVSSRLSSRPEPSLDVLRRAPVLPWSRMPSQIANAPRSPDNDADGRSLMTPLARAWRSRRRAVHRRRALGAGARRARESPAKTVDAARRPPGAIRTSRACGRATACAASRRSGRRSSPARRSCPTRNSPSQGRTRRADAHDRGERRRRVPQRRRLAAAIVPPDLAHHRAGGRTLPAADAGRAEARRAARSRQLRRRPVLRAGGLHAVRPLHHPRDRRLDPAGRLRQRQSHPADARTGRASATRWCTTRGSSRSTAVRTSARRFASTWATRAATGKAIRWSSRRRTSPTRRASAPTATGCGTAPT